MTSTRLLGAIVLLGAFLPPRARETPPATLLGITFTIDSTGPVPPPPEIVKRFGMPPSLVTELAGTVVFAGGRGRLDVTAVAHGPAIRTEGIVLAAPLAQPGDWYLFDSTGFVLVRPGAKTFSVFPLADDSYNVVGRREGWPAWFSLNR